MKSVNWICSILISAPFVVSAEIVERLVATVNDEIITQSDLAHFSEKINKGGFLDDLLLFGRTSEDIKKNKQEQLNYMIYERMMDSEVKRLNLSITIERVEQEIREIAKRNKMTKSELLSAIVSQGVSVSEYQDFLKSKIEHQSLVDSEIASKIRISDDEILTEYTQLHPSASTTGVYEYNIAHIFFNSKKGGAEAAQTRAEEVVQKLRAGGSFELLAEQHSEDSNFSSGGVLGTFKAGEFSQELEKAVTKINPGETTGVIKQKGNFHILKLLSKKLVSDPQFEKEKNHIREQLYEKTFRAQFKNWLNFKKEDSYIRVNK